MRGNLGVYYNIAAINLFTYLLVGARELPASVCVCVCEAPPLYSRRARSNYNRGRIISGAISSRRRPRRAGEIKGSLADQSKRIVVINQCCVTQ